MNVSQDEAITKARSQIKDASSLIRKVQKNAKQITETFLEDCATHLEEMHAITKAAALQQLISAERSSSVFKLLGICFKGKEYMSMDRMLVPDDPDDIKNTTWSSVLKHRRCLRYSQRTARSTSNKPKKPHLSKN
jgi:hypothetical protein